MLSQNKQPWEKFELSASSAEAEGKFAFLNLVPLTDSGFTTSEMKVLDKLLLPVK